MSDLSWGEFKQLEQQQAVESGSFWDSWSVDSVGETANNWLNVLANTSMNYNKLEDAFSGATSVSDNKTQKEYADITNAVPGLNVVSGVNNNTLILGGVTIIALFFIMGDN